MALEVETGTGSATADSYSSVADADTYIANYYGAVATWDDLDDPAKERALREATQYIDGKFSERWKGDRVSASQALEWPRYGVYLFSSEAGWVNSSTIPEKIKQACIELAYSAAVESAAGSSLDPTLTNDVGIKSESVRLGEISERIEYIGGKSGAKKFSKVWNMLKPYLESGAKLDRA